jgi:hypothetical protein
MGRGQFRQVLQVYRLTHGVPVVMEVMDIPEVRILRAQSAVLVVVVVRIVA